MRSIGVGTGKWVRGRVKLRPEHARTQDLPQITLLLPQPAPLLGSAPMAPCAQALARDRCSLPSCLQRRHSAPVTGSRVVLTYASRVARMGVLQGLAARAKVRPA